MVAEEAALGCRLLCRLSVTTSAVAVVGGPRFLSSKMRKKLNWAILTVAVRRFVFGFSVSQRVMVSTGERLDRDQRRTGPAITGN